MSKTRFGTAIICIDGRIQLPVIEWMKKEFLLDCIDMITEPAVVKILSHGDENELGRLKSKARISIEGHGSGVVAVVGHYDCFANQVSDLEHSSQIKKSVQAVQAWGYPVSIVGLWVGNAWRVDKLGL